MSRDGVVVIPFNIKGKAGDLFALHFVPSANREHHPERAVLYFPPFAEEMNKSRRMANLQARRLVELGYAVLMVDIFGTGDSQGEFADARWKIWRDDMESAVLWLRGQGVRCVIAWGLRLGTLLAMDVAKLMDSHIHHIVLWQPVVRGDSLMTQFLRLRVAADAMESGGQLTTKGLRSLSREGNLTEVAGYELAPSLLKSIDNIRLMELLGSSSRCIHWMEMVSSPTRSLTPASLKVVQSWRETGCRVQIYNIEGETFWNTPEITVVDGLLDKTTQVFQEMLNECP